MRKLHITIVTVIALLLIVPLINSCKKGTDDPKDAIFIKKWKLVSAAGTQITGTAATSTDTITYSFSDSILTIKNPPYLIPYPFYYTIRYAICRYEMIINKDGTFNYIYYFFPYNPHFAIIASTGIGIWSWKNNSKNESLLYMTADVYTYFPVPFSNGYYYIDELKSDELILIKKDIADTTSTDIKYTYKAI